MLHKIVFKNFCRRLFYFIKKDREVSFTSVNLTIVAPLIPNIFPEFIEIIRFR